MCFMWKTTPRRSKQLLLGYLDEFCQIDKNVIIALDRFGPNLVAEKAGLQAGSANKIWSNGSGFTKRSGFTNRQTIQRQRQP